MASTLNNDLKASLDACGVDPRRSVVISKFVSQCMGLVHAAHDNLIEPATWAAFLNKRGALSKTQIGKPRVKETAASADIALQAQILLKKKRKVRMSPAPSGYVASDTISLVQADGLMPSSVATGNSSKRPDLVFSPADPELEITFAVEAKVLEDQHDCRDVLLGPEGLGCFTRALDPYESNGIIGLFGYAEQAAASHHRASLQTVLAAGTVHGCTNVSNTLRACTWDGTTNDRESTLAYPVLSNSVCLGVVLDFPTIRQPVIGPAQKAAKKPRTSVSRKPNATLTQPVTSSGAQSASKSRKKP